MIDHVRTPDLQEYAEHINRAEIRIESLRERAKVDERKIAALENRVIGLNRVATLNAEVIAHLSKRINRIVSIQFGEGSPL